MNETFYVIMRHGTHGDEYVSWINITTGNPTWTTDRLMAKRFSDRNRASELAFGIGHVASIYA